MDVKDRRCQGDCSLEVFQDRAQYRAVVNMVIKHHVTYKTANFLTSLDTGNDYPLLNQTQIKPISEHIFHV
jgi:hypothetical protein